MIKAIKNIIGRYCVGRPASIYLAQRYPQHTIGRGTYGDLQVSSWGEGASLSIGAYTSIASGVRVFLGGEHRTEWTSTYPFNVLWASAQQYTGHPKTKGNVDIGNDVWIGTEALILSGVTVGNGAVIAARSVVSRDVPPYAIVAGNPARVVKYRFDAPVIARLLVLQWWNWDEARIEKAMAHILSPDVVAFLALAETGEI